jgi:hypothetical protein
MGRKVSSVGFCWINAFRRVVRNDGVEGATACVLPAWLRTTAAAETAAAVDAMKLRREINVMAPPRPEPAS